ncbi:MAG: thioredoxin family protein [Flavobacteriales bacterium]|nr:thioredoxin family protein [Flavobacteriales bacterium]|tara:strand:- start:334 stop:960 length:627 start_codon:yes stop_codon:yes gene_type:complete
MKKVSILAVLALAAFVTFSFTFGGEKYETLKIGKTAPMQDYMMNTPEGDAYSLESLAKEKGTLIIFSCNTCPFVVAWEDRYPEIAEMAEGLNIGFALVNSNTLKREDEDSPEAMMDHAEENGYSEIPYLIDQNSQLANAFGAKTTPHVFLFDAEMKLVYEGAIDDNFKEAEAVKATYLKDALNNLAEGKKINPQTTKAIGCSIKRPKE